MNLRQRPSGDLLQPARDCVWRQKRMARRANDLRPGILAILALHMRREDVAELVPVGIVRAVRAVPSLIIVVRLTIQPHRTNPVDERRLATSARIRQRGLGSNSVSFPEPRRE